MKTNPIVIEAVVKAPILKVWDYYNKPEHIVQWAFAADDWEAPAAENNLRIGGRFKTTMAAKDKSASFDFSGIYTVVKENTLREYDMDDCRHVKEKFVETPEGVKITITFDPETQNSREKQQAGWQAILSNFKKHVEQS